MSLLIRRYGLDLGAVVSASHNPFADNGIKFFGPDGTKLSDEEEARVEAVLAEPRQPPRPGRVRELHGAAGDYLRELELRFEGLDLAGKRVLLDCANGATYRVAPEIFRRLGADVTALAVEPDGRNINDGCGSTHVESLADAMREGEYDVGFAFDGDGDRVLAVDRDGAVVDGDELIALAALHLRGAGRLPGDGVAVTVMTNYGFHQAMEREGISVATTPVGDRNVLVELLRRGWALGGEQSGHIIDTNFVPAGDGIASALLTMEALAGDDLAARGAMQKLPQRLVNVRVADRGRARAGAGRLAGRRAGGGRARGPRPRAHPPVRHRAGRPRDGRGARRARVRGRHRTSRCGRRAGTGRALDSVGYVWHRRIRRRPALP